MQHDIIHILIPPGMWRDVDGDGSLLKCVFSINGTLMHLEAIHVHYVGTDHEQQAVDPRREQDFDLLSRYGSEGQFETSEINGRTYVLVATPFT